MPDEDEAGDERTQLARRLSEIRTELAAIERRIEQRLGRAAGAVGEESPEEKRRRFKVITGGAGGVAAAGLWVRHHGRDLTSALAGAAGGAAVTAAVIGHPGALPNVAPPPPHVPTAAVSTIGGTPAPGPTPTQERPRRRTPTTLPPIAVPTLRRRSGPPALIEQPATTPGPQPTLAAAPTVASSPAPSASRPRPVASPTPTCTVLLEASPILRVCL